MARRPINALRGVGNSGASAQVLMGYTSSSSASGSSHTQAARSDCVPRTVTASDTGKPPAIASLRHQLRPIGLMARPTMAAIGLATPGDISDCSNQRNMAQLRPQPSKAGAGQGGIKRWNMRGCVDKPVVAAQ